MTTRRPSPGDRRDPSRRAVPRDPHRSQRRPARPAHDDRARTSARYDERPRTSARYDERPRTSARYEERARSSARYDERARYDDRARYDERARTGARYEDRRPPVDRRPAPRRAPAPRPPRRPVRKPAVRLGDAHRRLRAATILMALVLSLFVGRLVQLQGLDAPAYAAEAESKRVRTVAVPALRGTIHDSRGVALATTVEAIDVTADPKLIGEAKKSSPAMVAAAIGPILGLDVGELTTRLTGTKRYVVVAKLVTPATWARVKALAPELRVGLVPVEVSKRVYPGGELAANIVGFVDAEGDGAGGLEMASDPLLAGKDGSSTFEETKGHRLPLGEDSTVAPVDGQDLTLTIDSDVQWVAQKAITKRVKEAKAASGDVVVLDTRTGKIVALATAPGFDPNQVGKTTASARTNRPLSDVFEPGSTSKVMTAAAVIEEKMATPATPVTVPNEIIRGGKSFHDSESHPTLNLTYAGVLAKSSNIGTILASEEMKDTTLHSYFTKFGIGRPSGLGFPGESRGILAKPADWSASQRYTVRFGQGLSVTSLQAASVFATIANDGVRIAPSLVDHWTDAEGKVTAAPEPEKERVVSAETAATVRTMMEAVVGEGGTAPMAAIPGYRVAGKTGTANRVVDGKYRGYTSSFIGLAPADKPRFVVAVILQDPKNGHYGGVLGGPVFKEVMSFVLKTAHVPPTETKRPVLPLETG